MNAGGNRRQPVPTHEAFLRTRHFSGLDGLRAISVVAVVWSHLGGPRALKLLNQGHVGVDLFFAISGFLVTTLLLRERRETGSISLRNFYIRRSLRIFPLYYAVLATYCLLVFATLGGTSKAAEFYTNLPAFATFTSNWFVPLDNPAGHGVTFYFAWSLATEEQFYLFWPPLMIVLAGVGRGWWGPCAAALALLGVQSLAAVWEQPSFLAKVVGSLAPAILLGVVFALLLERRSTFDGLAWVAGRRLAAPLLAVSVLTLLQLDAPGFAVRLCMALLVVSVCMREDTFLHPLLTLRPLVLVGTTSYGIYLMHMLAGNVVRRLLRVEMGWAVFLGTLLLVIPVAYLSFRYFETPLIRLKARLGAVTPLPRQLAAPP